MSSLDYARPGETARSRLTSAMAESLPGALGGGRVQRVCLLRTSDALLVRPRAMRFARRAGGTGGVAHSSIILMEDREICHE